MTSAEPAAIERLRADVADAEANRIFESESDDSWLIEATLIRALLRVADAAKVLDGNLDRYEHADSKLWGQLEGLSAALDALEALP